MDAVQRLLEVMRRLRAPGGCPWDREQTHLSLRPYVIEEAHEVVDAIRRQDMHKLADELGDLLLQVVFHAVIAEERGDFTFEDVADGLVRKLVRRHPHVFGTAEVESADEVERQWQQIKAEERGAEKGASLLDDLTPGLPALMQAQKIQARVAQAGFDWETAEAAWPKVEEELAEFRRAWQAGDRAGLESEWGDVVFALVNIARLLNIQAEIALQDTNARFCSRFRNIERLAQAEGEDLLEMSLDEMDRLWEEAKKLEKEGPETR